MQWKWKEWEHSAVKMACPCPVFIEFRQIAHVPLEDLDLDLERRRLEDDDEIPPERWPEASPDGETRSEKVVAEEDECSIVLGT